MLKTFHIKLRNRYQALENEEQEPEVEEVEREFRVMKKAYIKAAEIVLGRPQKKTKP